MLAEPALSWRVRGPGALRRLRVLLRLDLRRRCVGGGCNNQSNQRQNHAQIGHSHLSRLIALDSLF